MQSFVWKRTQNNPLTITKFIGGCITSLATINYANNHVIRSFTFDLLHLKIFIYVQNSNWIITQLWYGGSPTKPVFFTWKIQTWGKLQNCINQILKLRVAQKLTSITKIRSIWEFARDLTTEREWTMWVTNLLPPNSINSSAERITHDMVIHTQNQFSSHAKWWHGRIKLQNYINQILMLLE
jgi:hypothetical protein